MTILLAASMLCADLLMFVILWKRDSGTFLMPAPFVLFGLTELRSVWSAAVYAYFMGIADAYPMMAVASGFMCFLLGYVLAHAVLRRTGSHDNYQQQPLKLRKPGTSYALTITIISVALVLVGMRAYDGLGVYGSVVRGLVSGRVGWDWVAGYTSQARLTFTKSHYFGGEYTGQGAISTLMQVGWTYLLLASVMVLRKERTAGYALLAACVSVGATVFVSAAGSRSPLGHTVLVVLVGLMMAQKVRPRVVVGALVLVVVLLVLLSTLSSKASNTVATSGSIAPVAREVLERIFLPNGLNNVYTIQLLRSSTIDYRYGDVQWTYFLNALPGTSFGGMPFEYELSYWLNAGPTTFSSTTYLGHIYADFGLPGVVVIYFLIGVTLAVSALPLLRVQKTPFEHSLVAYICYYLGMISSSGFPGLIARSLVLLLIHGTARAMLAALAPSAADRMQQGSTMVRHRYTGIRE